MRQAREVVLPLQDGLAVRRQLPLEASGNAVVLTILCRPPGEVQATGVEPGKRRPANRKR